MADDVMIPTPEWVAQVELEVRQASLLCRQMLAALEVRFLDAGEPSLIDAMRGPVRDTVTDPGDAQAWVAIRNVSAELDKIAAAVAVAEAPSGDAPRRAKRG